MLVEIPTSRVPHEWDTIRAGLSSAVKRDPKANWLDMLGMGITGQMRFWAASGPVAGIVAVEVQRQPGTLRRALAVIYAGGLGNGKAMRQTMAEIEAWAAKLKCAEVRFEGRKGWQRVFPDYHADEGADGRMKYRKVIA